MSTHTSPGRLESKIGLYWLNRLGVGSLVVGLALALMLSFLSWPAILKITAGFLCAGLLLFAGEELIRKTNMNWYGQGLIGGGWSLAFFTGFVAHHIPALCVIGSPAVDSVLLLAIAIASMMHSVIRRSQTIAALVVFLGTFTICLTQVGFFTACALALLNAGICAVAVRMRWFGLLAIGSLGFYGGYLLSGSPYAMWLGSPHNNGLMLSSALLIPGWLMYSLSIPFFDEHEPTARRALVAVSCINASGFIFCMLHALDAFAPHHRSLFLFATATIYALSLWAISRRNLPTISTINQLLALSLATIAISDNLSGTWLSGFLLAEVALLTAVGLAYNIKEFRWFSAAVAPFAFAHLLEVDFVPCWISFWVDNQLTPAISGTTYLGLAAIASFGSAAAMHRWELYRAVQGKLERNTYFYLYFSLAAVLVALFPLLGPPAAWHAGLWMFGGVALICTGLRLPDQYVRLGGHLDLFLATLALMGSAPGWAWLPTLLAAGALTIAGRQYGLQTLTGKSFTLAAIGLVSLLLWFRLSANWLSIFLTAEGFLLVVSGFYLSARPLRLLGLSSFAVLVVRLLLLELGKADSVHTVLSFFTAGGVLLGASAVYAWLSARHAETDPASKHEIGPANVPVAEGPPSVLPE